MKRLFLVVALLLSTLAASTTALAACTEQSISVGETKNGSLSTDDCATTSGYYYDAYQFTGASGQQLYILNSSSAFDVDLMLIYPDATTYLYDDDSGGGTNARIPASGYLTLPASGLYTIAASSAIALKTGAYTLTLTGATTPPATSGTSVIEFYNTNLNHYFMTGDSQEAAGIDNGAAGPGWSRTGYEVNAWQTQSEASSAANAVCRFYGTPGVGPNSHFYTADAGECALVKQDPGWFYEGIALYSQPVQYGSCPLGTTPVYQVYNNRWMHNDSNHRFITDSVVYQQMIQQGWAAEGLVMCVNGSSYPTPVGGTTATIGTSGGTVTDGNTTITFPANAVTAATTVTISPGSATNDFPDATVVSDIKAVEIEGDIYQPIQIKMTATGAISGKVFAVVATDTYTASSAVPFFRGVLHEATVAGNILSVTIPPSAFGSQSTDASPDRYSSMAADGSTSKAKRRFTVWFITGYDLLQSGHFSITYPVKPCNSLVIRDYLDIAEDAYTKLITNIGFSPSGLAWPMSINVIKLDPGKYGEAGYGRIGRWISGTKSLSLSINQQYCNSSSQADMDEMKATIGHEFFHTIQYVYDPHWAVRESVFGSPFTWLMEASSTWFEAEMLNNSSYASPVFTGNADFYRNGLEHGGQVDAQEHGYGASGFLRYLTSKFGNGLILSTWAKVNGQSGTYSSTGALASANVILSSEWQTFAEQYLTATTSFGWSAPGSVFSFTYSDTKPTAEFTDDLYPLSGVKIGFNFNSLKQNKNYTLTLAEGKNSFIKAHLYKYESKTYTKIAEFTDKYAFDATPGSGFFLIVLNSDDTAPYTTPTHIKIKLESGPTITALSPTQGPVDTAVTITGTGFGTSADTRSVYFSGLVASNVTWSSDTSAVAKVPQNASTGDVVVEVNAVKSNGMNFEVLAQCSSTQNAGGDTPDTRTIELGKSAGTFDFSYDTYWQEDQILVKYEGATLFDTGCVGAYATKALTYSGSSKQITVQVIPNCKGGSGTAWNYTVACP